MLHEQGDLRKRTFQLGRRVAKLFVALPRSRLAQIYGEQLVRSANSVGANYREACRARSKAEFICKIGDCLKEADETTYWLELIEEEGLLGHPRLEPLLREPDELVAILVTISKRTRGD